jgi:GDP/UDP-N,N'-diacetylbacillosamine 2-epimerase (hydrolysing)
LKVAFLTSSRADYGIAIPLLKAIKSDPFFDLQVIAFGTHLSVKHGETVNLIITDGFDVSIKVDSMPLGDSPDTIAAAMGKTMINFSKVWNENQFDFIIALGDRYEMFAACASSIPFNIPIAHIHGGETTLGAFDDAFRHSITQMATIHFTTTEHYKQRVVELKGSDKNVYNVGALSIDNLHSLQLLTIEEFNAKFNINLSIPSILITFQPETVNFEKNRVYVDNLIAALKEIRNYQFIITMPNADTSGNMIREQLAVFIAENSNAIGIESFGTLGYLSCMKHCSMLLGNTSSGFVEASFFPKYVINIGERQRGRILTENIYNCKIDKEEIISAVKNFKHTQWNQKIELYGNGTTASKIVSELKRNNQIKIY